MKLKSIFLGLAAFTGVALHAGAASADYVCQINNPGKNASSGYGTQGGFFFTTYTGKDCTGTFVRSYNVCTASATLSQCTKNTNGLYDRETMMAIYTSLRAAAAENLRFSITTATCVDNTSGCFAGVAFMAD